MCTKREARTAYRQGAESWCRNAVDALCQHPHCPQSPRSPVFQSPPVRHACEEKDDTMMRHLLWSLWSLVLALVVCLGAPRSLAQGGPGVVIAVSAPGRATVKIGDKEQTVSLPEAKVRDKGVCTVKDTDRTWEGAVQK